MGKTVEYRIFKTEVRAASEGKPQIEGYAAVFNVATDLGYVRESIAPGAFTDAIAEKQDVRCLFNHDANHVLGRTKSGTLALSEDNTGLKFVCDMPDTQSGKDVHAMIMRGDIDQCSFGFIVRDEEITYGENEVLRVIKKCDLFDVSPVTYPAYPTTSVEARSNEAILNSYNRSIEDGVDGDGDNDEDDGAGMGEVCSCRCMRCREAHPTEEEQKSAADLAQAKAHALKIQIESGI